MFGLVGLGFLKNWAKLEINNRADQRSVKELMDYTQKNTDGQKSGQSVFRSNM